MKVCTDSCLFGALIEIDNNAKHILDIGAGTGLLSLMCAQKSAEEVSIDGIEFVSDAYHQAKENVANTAWANRVQMLHGDFFTYDFTKKYDLLICNPPFYKQQYATKDVHNNIARHNENFDLIHFLEICDYISSEQAQVYLLLPYYRSTEIIDFLQTHPFWQIKSNYTIYNKAKKTPIRTVFIITKMLKKQCLEKNIYIYDINNQYTSEFKQLLEPYYL